MIHLLPSAQHAKGTLSNTYHPLQKLPVMNRDLGEFSLQDLTQYFPGALASFTHVLFQLPSQIPSIIYSPFEREPSISGLIPFPAPAFSYLHCLLRLKSSHCCPLSNLIWINHSSIDRFVWTVKKLSSAPYV